MEKIIRESAFDKKERNPGLKFNPELALTRRSSYWAQEGSPAFEKVAVASLDLKVRSSMKKTRRFDGKRATKTTSTGTHREA